MASWARPDQAKAEIRAISPGRTVIRKAFSSFSPVLLANRSSSSRQVRHGGSKPRTEYYGSNGAIRCRGQQSFACCRSGSGISQARGPHVVSLSFFVAHRCSQRAAVGTVCNPRHATCSSWHRRCIRNLQPKSQQLAACSRAVVPCRAARRQRTPPAAFKQSLGLQLQVPQKPLETVSLSCSTAAAGPRPRARWSRALSASTTRNIRGNFRSKLQRFGVEGLRV